MTKIDCLICEYRSNPLGIDVTDPRLGWQLQTERHGARQTAYRILASSTLDQLQLGAGDLWDSGKIESDQSVHVIYAGQPLTSRQRVYWGVTVWDETGKAAESAPAWFELGLLQSDDWKGEWIGAALSGGAYSMIPAPYLRKPFTLPAAVTAARLYITALGLYQCSINGQPVSDDVLTPGWTDYRQRVQYKVYDVTDKLHGGDNVLGVVLGDGWAVGHIGWAQRQQYVERPMLLAQLEVRLADGSTFTTATDSSWKYQYGPILHNDLLMGEAYDARKEFPDWDRPNFDDAQWSSAEALPNPKARIVAANGPTVRPIHELKPITLPHTQGASNHQRHLFDLGQNMVGRVRFTGTAPAGTTVTFRFAEVLDSESKLYTQNLRSARAVDYYTFKGVGVEIWEPKFTFHGFRYVEIEGYSGEVNQDTITGIVLHSEMTPTGEFSCSDPLVNQLQRNITWGQKGNFVDIPTDCPQRDERLGWTGDIQVFVRTAAYNMEVAGFMTKWLRDLADAQTSDGAVPSVAPLVAGVTDDGGPAWADAAVICPWTLYLCYGDQRILETSYDMMTRFMTFITAGSPTLIRCAPNYAGWLGYGDWLSINADTPRDLIGTAFLAYDASLMAQIADVLGKTEDAVRYRQLFEDVKAAFAARYLVGSQVSDAPSIVRKNVDEADRISRGLLKTVDYGTMTSNVFNTALFTPTQTAYVLALHFNLLPEHLRPMAVAELVADIERRGIHLSTGFVGSSYVNPVLSANGRTDVAYSLLQQKTWPSWLYPVTVGATTIWERWDGWTEENGFQTPEMNSFNHYAYGAIGAWLYATVAGIEIDPSQPAYKHIIFRPQPGGGLTQARGTLKTLYGELVSQWKIDQGKWEYTVVVPPNTSATVYLPAQQETPIMLNSEATDTLVHKLGAGRYQFTIG
jgi:alpha-L-rhamnosidase